MKPGSSRLLLWPITLAATVALLWVFPSFWYTKHGDGRMRWLGEKVEVPSWSYRSIPVDEVAEKILVADRMFNAEFTNHLGQVIRVFSAKRYDEKANEIGLFIHTPDRCWVEGGWQMDGGAEPTCREITMDGAIIPAERRIFSHGDQRELVYFFGLQDGRPLPYRLDHYLSTGRKFTAAGDGRRELIRVSDRHFWERLWESFKSRRAVRGPKQFVRISTSLGTDELKQAEERLSTFLHDWLIPTDYEAEKTAWKLAVASNPKSLSE